MRESLDCTCRSSWLIYTLSCQNNVELGSCKSNSRLSFDGSSSICDPAVSSTLCCVWSILFTFTNTGSCRALFSVTYHTAQEWFVWPASNRLIGISLLQLLGFPRVLSVPVNQYITSGPLQPRRDRQRIRLFHNYLDSNWPSWMQFQLGFQDHNSNSEAVQGAFKNSHFLIVAFTKTMLLSIYWYSSTSS